MIILKMLAFVLLAAGFIVVFTARFIVGKYNLDRTMKCSFENDMDDEELRQYKINKAVVNIKMLGMLIALPGLVLLLMVLK